MAMNFWDALLKMMFGGPKAAPTPPKPAPRKAPPVAHPHEQDVGAPQEIHLEPPKEPAKAPPAQPARPAEPAQPAQPAPISAAGAGAAGAAIVDPSDPYPPLHIEAMSPVKAAKNFIPYQWNGVMPLENRLGDFQWEDAPTTKDERLIRIKGDWESKNIGDALPVPELAEATNGRFTRMRFHKAGAGQMLALWRAWKQAGLLHHIHNFDGGYYARYQGWKKGEPNPRILSNHAFGSAFDINPAENERDKEPARMNRFGCVRPLVPLAHEFGFYWGGHFRSRRDGMHFELARIMSSDELEAAKRKANIA